MWFLVGVAACEPRQAEAVADGPAQLALSRYVGHPSFVEAWGVNSGAPLAQFGAAVASAGDVNGDGLADVAAGAPRTSGEPYYPWTAAGVAAVWYGSADAGSSIPNWLGDGTQVPSGCGQQWFGVDVAAADVNGDGMSDLLVGAESWASVHSGGSGGLRAVWLYDWSSTAYGFQGACDRFYQDSFNGFGWTVSSLGDANGDGLDDIAVGAPEFLDATHVYVNYGSAAGLSAMADTILEVPSTGDEPTPSPIDHADVDGDGLQDLLVGVPDAGVVYVFRGTADGFDAAWAWSLHEPAPGFGHALGGPGDLNGDGYDDIVVSAVSDAAADSAVFVYYGSSGGPSAVPDAVLTGQPASEFGYALALVGDVDGDGMSDLVVGAPEYYDAFSSGGGVFLFLGSVAGIQADPTWSDVSVAQARARFGAAVAAAGDVNGDGTPDLVVGAPGHDGASGADEGRVTLYYGAPCAGDPASGDADRDGFCLLGAAGEDGDCNDADPTVFPGAPEVCNGRDDACEGELSADELDVDGDGVLPCAGDCDDADPAVYVGAPELCDGKSNACAGAAPLDERDLDADGVSACGGDCNDEASGQAPGRAEACDGVDNDCDGSIQDEPCPAPEPGCGCATTEPASGALAAVLAWFSTRRRRLGSGGMRQTPTSAAASTPATRARNG